MLQYFQCWIHLSVRDRDWCYTPTFRSWNRLFSIFLVLVSRSSRHLSGRGSVVSRCSDLFWSLTLNHCFSDLLPVKVRKTDYNTINYPRKRDWRDRVAQCSSNIDHTINNPILCQCDQNLDVNLCRASYLAEGAASVCWTGGETSGSTGHSSRSLLQRRLKSTSNKKDSVWYSMFCTIYNQGIQWYTLVT